MRFKSEEECVFNRAALTGGAQRLSTVPVMDPNDAHSLLREATRPWHDSIERSLPLMRPGLTLSRYGAILARYWGFYGPWEAVVGEVLADEAFFGPRRKLRLIESDLAALGIELAALPRCAGLPALDGRAAALGSLYVIEGSTLGGQLLSRHVRDCLGLGPGDGGAFLASYGPAVGEMWRATRARLGRDLAAPHALAAAVAAARSTFEAMERWMEDVA